MDKKIQKTLLQQPVITVWELESYYKDLFSTSNPNLDAASLEKIPCMVTDEMNAELVKEFTALEVKEALNQMAPLKAPGPDGMPPLFYQHFWSIMQHDVTSAILSWLNSGILPDPINHTLITLVPKIANPELVSEFRPISLCNVLYKIYSKVLANRLKKFLPSLITEHQSAFAKDRLISDNIMVAFETLHHMKHHNSRKHGFMAVKLDMSKAYDRVEWVYLERLMERMGFCSRWITLMMSCVRTVSYSIMVNGEPTGMIHPSRGIRQGDPLSPFLFLLCTEGLHALIKHSARNGNIKGFSMCNRGPKLTHLFFADDSLLFCRSIFEDCNNVLKLLAEYESLSGQKINKEKTAIFFSKSTSDEEKTSIKNLFQIQEVKSYEKYLGLPSFVGRGKKASFNYIKERVWRKLQGWEGKLLSQAGREVLIKSVIQAIPTYAMGCFKLPLGLCDDIEAMIKKFWWGQRGNRRKIHWIRWGELTKSKMVGGMGFRDLAQFNDALLAKQAWRLLHNKETLFFKVFKAKFFPNCSFIEAKESSSSSYAWKSILQGRDVILDGACWRVGNGKSIKIWQHHWLPRKHPTKVLSPMVESMEEATVDCLIDEGTRTWNAAMVDGIFAPQEAEEIKNIPLARTATDDSLFWPWEHDGSFSCKSGYRFLKEDEAGLQVAEQPDHEKGLWKKIWALECPNKIRNLIWRACRNSLPSKCNLLRRTIITDQLCDRCKEVNEDVLHAVWSCKELDNVWGMNNLWNFRNHQCFSSFSELMAWVFQHQRNPALFAFIVWSVWYQRNQVRTQQSHCPLNQLYQVAHDRFAEYKVVQPSQLTSRLTRRARWKPPDLVPFKINFDGAISAEEKCSGLGVIIRNQEGLVTAAMSMRVPQQLQPIEIEALAAHKALEFAREVGISEAVLEGDSLLVMKALNTKNIGLAPFGLLLHDSVLLSTGFSKLSYSHTKREGNLVAHNLAQLAINISNCVIWMEDVPSDVLSSYQADLAGIS